MSIKYIMGLIFLFASALSSNVTLILTRSSVKLTGGELKEQYPERGWIRYSYPFLYLVIFFGGIFLFLLSFTRSEMLIFVGENWLFLIGGVLGLIPLFNGIFTLVTGTIPINRRRQHLYVVDEDVNLQVGFVLLGVGASILMAATMAILFWP